MKYRTVPLILLLLLAGCAQEKKETFVQYVTPNSTSLETFSVSYPDWEEINATDDFTVVSLQRDDKRCNLQLNKIEGPIEWYIQALTGYVLQNNGTIISESPDFTYELNAEGKFTLLFKVFGTFCADNSYYVMFFCLNDSFDGEMYQKITASMSCNKSWSSPAKPNKKLGMVINPVNDSNSYIDFANSFNIARNAGVQVTHYSIFWGDAEPRRGEYNWTVQDFIMNFIRYKGLEVSAKFHIIHTSVIGKLPGDLNFTSFDDPALISRFKEFILAYLARYKNVIKYVEIGNEVDIYLNEHKSEVPGYVTLYREVYSAIKEAYPGIKVGTVFAYHDMKRNNAQWIYHNLSIGDMDSFTLYIYNDGFIFDRDPSELSTYLHEIEELTVNRTFAFEEVGWNTYPTLKGTEEDQVKAVDYFFDYLEGAPQRLEFMNWFFLHDGGKKNCLKIGETFFEPNNPWLNNTAFMDTFSDFICYLGLIRNDGAPKQAWSEFVFRAKQ
jgi:hypothetical protein